MSKTSHVVLVMKLLVKAVFKIEIWTRQRFCTETRSSKGYFHTL